MRLLGDKHPRHRAVLHLAVDKDVHIVPRGVAERCEEAPVMVAVKPIETSALSHVGRA